MQHGIVMQAATGDTRRSVATDHFDLPLPEAACRYHIFKKGDVRKPLLSVGKACDAGCDEVRFRRRDCTFHKNGEITQRGFRDPHGPTKLHCVRQGFLDDTFLPRAAEQTPRLLESRDDIEANYSCHEERHTTNIDLPLGLGLPPQAQAPPRMGLSAYAMQTVPQLM